MRSAPIPKLQSRRDAFERVWNSNRLGYKAEPLSGFDVDTAEGIISGYVARFNRRDQVGDVILPGAFKASIAERMPLGQIPLLKQHDIQKTIGRPLSLTEDQVGLKGEFKISPTTIGNDELILIAHKAVPTFSFGYRVKPGGSEVVTSHPPGIKGVIDGVPSRYLSAIDIREVSTVVLSIEDGATIDEIRSESRMDTKSSHGLRDLAAALDHAGWVSFFKENGARLSPEDETIIREIIEGMRDGEKAMTSALAEALHQRDLQTKAGLIAKPSPVEPDYLVGLGLLITYNPLSG